MGRIDLLSKVHSGAVTIDTDMTATERTLPEMRPVGAIDGSTGWASSAVRDRRDGTGRFTLNLDRVYTLTKAGLSLHPGLPSAAVVEVSTDRTQWTKVVDTGSITSYALTYFPVDKVAAKYVRVTVQEPLSFTTNGVNEAGAPVAAFQIAVQSDGRLAWYSAATRAWTKFTTVEQAIAQKTWAAIEVRATPAGAEVFLNGTSVGTVPPTNTGVTALTGHTFSTSGTAPAYDNVVIDDVEQS